MPKQRDQVCSAAFPFREGPRQPDKVYTGRRPVAHLVAVGIVDATSV